jgi:ATP-dependent Clp protease, protease subunit
MHYTVEISSLLKEVELRKSPVIITVNDFNTEAAEKFYKEVSLAHSTGQKVIPVVISSYGGEVYSLMKMISAIKNAELPVATIVEGHAMSCGAVLFSFGHEGYRFVDPDATIMIHDVSSFAMGKIEEVKSSAKEADRLNEKLYTMMARNCGKKDDYFLKIVEKKKQADWFFDANDAVKHNLANYARVPKLRIKVGVDIDFE